MIVVGDGELPLISYCSQSQHNTQQTAKPTPISGIASGIAQLRKASDQNHQHSSDAMNLDEFIFSDNMGTPAGISPSPELEKKEPLKSSNSVASAIPIKMRKEAAANNNTIVPQSVPATQHGPRSYDEFDYVQKHVRKTSVDERRVR